MSLTFWDVFLGVMVAHLVIEFSLRAEARIKRYYMKCGVCGRSVRDVEPELTCHYVCQFCCREPEER